MRRVFGTRRGVFNRRSGGSTSGPVFLPTVGAFASLGNININTLPNRTISTSQLAGMNSPSSPLKYKTLTINAGVGLNVDYSTYSSIFIWCDTLILGSSTSFLNVSGTDGATSSCNCGGTGGGGGGGGSGGGGGAGPVPNGPSPGFPGDGGSGVDGTSGDYGAGGPGLGHLYSGAFSINGGDSASGNLGGKGFGGGGNGSSSENLGPICGCDPCSCYYSGGAGGGGGANGTYVVANHILGGAGRLFANGGNAGLNPSGNLNAYGGGGGVHEWYARSKVAGTITTQVLGSGGGNGNILIDQINGPTDNSANSLTAKTFSGSW